MRGDRDGVQDVLKVAKDHQGQLKIVRISVSKPISRNQTAGYEPRIFKKVAFSRSSCRAFMIFSSC